MNIRYREYPAPDYLSDYVKGFWTMERCATAELPDIAFSPMPDGFPGLIFQLGETTAFHDAAKHQMPAIFIFGQTINRKQMLLSGEISTLGISFFPSAIKSIFNLDACEVADDCLSYELISKKDFSRLHQHISLLDNHQQRIRDLSGYLYQLLEQRRLQPEKVDFATAQMLKSGGRVSIREISATLGLSERSLERQFKTYVGVSPQTFLRICRFQAALKNMQTLKFEKLSDLAYDFGYADQSHFIREFKAFSGASPLQFLKGRKELVYDLQQFS